MANLNKHFNSRGAGAVRTSHAPLLSFTLAWSEASVATCASACNTQKQKNERE